jgi:hypothetical protein
VTIVQDPLAPLRPALSRLVEASYALRMTVTEDRPHDGTHRTDLKPFADLQEGVDDLVDCLAELHAVVGSEPDRGSSASAVDAMSDIHALVIKASRLLHQELMGVEGRYYRASQASGSLGGPWRPWSRVVLTGLVECRDGLGSLESALPDLWSALAVTRAPKEDDR